MNRRAEIILVLVLLGLGTITGIFMGRACSAVHPPTTVVAPDTVVVEKPVIIFRDRPELAEKVHLVTKGSPAVKETLEKVQAIPVPIPDSSTVWKDTAGKPMPLVRVTLDGEKLFTQQNGTVRYGWTGTGNCEVQLEEGGQWYLFGSSPIDLIGSHAVAIEPLSKPVSELARNRFLLGAGYGTNGWAGTFGVSRSFVWKNRFTKTIMPDEVGVQAVMHASHDVDGLMTMSWRF